MKALDLFCGAGGASAGLARAGFDVVGVDIAPMPEYPFEFIRGDALRPPVRLEEFDLIWASPQCQRWSAATQPHRAAGKIYPNQIPVVRTLLQQASRPYIIENVPQAPLRFPVALTGPVFGLRVIRRRHFEIGGFHVEQPRIPHPAGTAKNGDYEAVFGKSGTHDWDAEKKRRRRCNLADPPKRTQSGKRERWREAMKIDWMTKKQLAQAIPPAYAEYLAREFLRTREGA